MWVLIMVSVADNIWGHECSWTRFRLQNIIIIPQPHPSHPTPPPLLPHTAYYTEPVKILPTKIKTLSWISETYTPWEFSLTMILNVYMLTEHMHTAKHLSLTDNFKELQQYMEGVGNPDSKTCTLKCFTSNVAIDIIRYLSRSLFQHYRLCQHLFTEQQEEERISIRVSF